MGSKIRAAIGAVIIFVLFPLLLFLSAFVFGGSHYYIMMSAASALCLAAYFVNFERGSSPLELLLIIAAAVALCVVGRLVFFQLPGFKPVTAIVVIVGIYLGSGSGFMTGAMAALISNFFFGQGPWTPFQMFVWGVIGYCAGLLAGPLKKSRVLLIVYGVLCGAAFSLMMDVFTVTWYDGTFNWALYKASVINALPFTAAYIVSDTVFLLILTRPIGKKLDRVVKKYGLLDKNRERE